MSNFTAKNIEQALIDIENLTSDRGERISFKPTHMMLNDPDQYDIAVEIEKAARKDAFGDGIDALSRSDVVMMLNDAGAKIESNSHMRYPSPDSFVEFDIGTNKGYFIVSEQRLYIWSGVGEWSDYAAEIKVKSAEHFADILRVLA